MKKTCRLMAAVMMLAAPALASAADPAAEKAADKAAGAETGPAPDEVLPKLSHSNQMEIEAGKLAQEKGESKAVKNFGKALVRDHTAAQKQVTALAEQLNVMLPTEPPMKHDMLERAKALSGAEFDRAFAQAMLEDHAKEVDEAKDARDKTSNAKLKKLLTALVPKLEQHRVTAQKLVDADSKMKEGTSAAPAKTPTMEPTAPAGGTRPASGTTGTGTMGTGTTGTGTGTAPAPSGTR